MMSRQISSGMIADASFRLCNLHRIVVDESAAFSRRTSRRVSTSAHEVIHTGMQTRETGNPERWNRAETDRERTEPPLCTSSRSLEARWSERRWSTAATAAAIDVRRSSVPRWADGQWDSSFSGYVPSTRLSCYRLTYHASLPISFLRKERHFPLTTEWSCSVNGMQITAARGRCSVVLVQAGRQAGRQARCGAKYLSAKVV